MSIRGRGYPPPTVKTFLEIWLSKTRILVIIKLKLTKSREKYDMIAVEFVFTPEHQGGGGGGVGEGISPGKNLFVYKFGF